MPDRGQSDDELTDKDVASIDTDVLDRIGGYLSGSERFSDVEVRPKESPNSVIAEYNLGYFPSHIQTAYIQIRWYKTDDFNVHYREQHNNDDTWECRWDRHPNSHNTRDHFHPPPVAEKPGEDADFSNDWREVLTLVIDELDSRVRSFWE